MTQWTVDNIIYIMAPKGYARKVIQDKGIKVFSPYYGDNLPLRLFRELCFRLPFLPKTIWYNKAVLHQNVAFVNIIDVNITEHYLRWIKKIYSDVQINFIYDNMVGRARNISPDKIPSKIRIWTYDDYDSKKYGIRLFNKWASPAINIKKQNPEIDVFFIGRDKGRGEQLLELEKKMNSLGLKTKFIITKDRKYSRTKSFYQNPISYEQVVEYDAKSRALLNITMPNQEGVTMRDIEATVIGIKLITTNKNIINKDLYHKKNVFILGEDQLSDLPSFLKEDYVNVWETIKENHTIDAMLDEITC